MSWLGAVERTVTGMGYDLVDAERSAGGLLRVFIDRPFGADKSVRSVVVGASESAVQGKDVSDESGGEAFINVDDCERVTRQLQHVLEVEGCAYERLEVSSPGLDRPLKKSSDYLRFVGEPIEITLKQPFQGRKKYRGELQAAGEGWRLLLAEDAEGPAAKANPKAKKGAPAKPPAPESPDRVLDFSLDEVRDARLVPVLDFNGRRLVEPEVGVVGVAALADDKMDGGGIQ